MITLLVDPERFGSPELRVEGEPYRHLFRARRLAAGERLRVVDGRGRARWGEVAAVDRAAGTVRLGDPAPPNEPALHLDLLVAAFRPERAAWLVEKATELGAASVRFLHTARAPRTFGAGTVDRLRRVAAAAVEQCHRSRLPEVTGTHPWSELPGLAPAEARIFLDVGGLSPVREVRSASVALLVGPEGGWSPEERAELLAAGWRAAGLGERVLRVETAALAGAAMLLLAGG